jgi:hypothetical protein
MSRIESIHFIVLVLLGAACTNPTDLPGDDTIDDVVRDGKEDGGDIATTPIERFAVALDEGIAYREGTLESQCATGTAPGDLQLSVFSMPASSAAALIVTPVAQPAGARLVVTGEYEPDIWDQYVVVSFELAGQRYGYENWLDEGRLVLPDGSEVALRCLDVETEI